MHGLYCDRESTSIVEKKVDLEGQTCRKIPPGVWLGKEGSQEVERTLLGPPRTPGSEEEM